MSEELAITISIALSLAGTAVVVCLAAALRTAERRLRALRLNCLEMRMQLRAAALNKILIGENAKLVARGIDQGSIFIETGHRVVSEVTFGLLQLFPATRGRAHQIRETHNAISQGIYGVFREINRQVGGSIAEGLKNPKLPTKKRIGTLKERRQSRRTAKKKTG